MNDLVIGYSKESSVNVQYNETDPKEDKSEYFFQIIKENVDKLSNKDKEISKLEKEIEELKAKVNEELKKQGYDPLD